MGRGCLDKTNPLFVNKDLVYKILLFNNVAKNFWLLLTGGNMKGPHN